MSPFPVLRRLHADDFTSGEQLAEALNVSRASISLALRDAAELGVSIESRHGKGYRLHRPVDWLEESVVASHLGTALRFFDLRCFDEIDSTNAALIKAAHDGAPSGMVYAAEYQTAGRGRRGRQWRGELGGTLMYSLLWRFNLGLADLSGLSLAVGLAVVRALQSLGVSGAQLKWPNDIVCDAGKLGGILIELAGEAHGPVAAVLGIGLNVRMSDDNRAAIDQPVATLDDLGLKSTRNQLLACLLRELADVLNAFSHGGFSPLLKEWESHHRWHGQPVSMLMPDGSKIQGTVVGVSDEGALKLACEDGIRQFHSGEVSLRGAA
ncbi:biotin--[acetyl-CoA-carboxylase] ligase [Burkholderiaceae bacterium DAT-1]|nr:biotin--[acetyl-CoA-carboxylase] ligase [Burkholderiaceae bacterium DAT-1]